MSRVVTFDPASPSLPRSVVAIGAFDGVHLGHQALLADTVADAHARGAASVAITFDRDPDQVVTPDAAAPQLLTLEDKLAFIGECGIDTILVVPFTPSVAAQAPSRFLDADVSGAVEVLAVHVGDDFRFGAKAAGDLATLESWARGRGIDVYGHDLVKADSWPVTSTRIRGLIAEGDVGEAAALLGRPHRVTGTVGAGRQEGAALGFPTANLTPAPYAALPADGVYAGRALLSDGSSWPAAISVGTPPTFPEARDYLEVHLIGFEGDLYGATLTLEFLERLRDQRAFASADELSQAIGADVAAAKAIAEDDDVHTVGPDAGAAGASPRETHAGAQAWVEVASTTLFGPLATLAGDRRSGVALQMALDAANIPYRWEPFDPQHAAPTAWRTPTAFHLMVPGEFAEEAAAVLAEGASEPSRGADGADDTDATADLDFWEGEDIADEDLLEDPAALAAAQAAVNEARPISLFGAAPTPEAVGPDDENAWVFLATGPAPGPIEFLSEALREADIETLWEPFAPEKRAAFWGRTELTVYVPCADIHEARRLADDIGAWDDDARV